MYGNVLSRVQHLYADHGLIGGTTHIARSIARRVTNGRAPYAAEWQLITSGRWDDAIERLSSKRLDCEGYFALGAAHHARGSLADAVVAWTIGVSNQAEAISDIESPVRYLGETFTNSIGHTALLDIFAKQKVLGVAPCRYEVVYNRATAGNLDYLKLWQSHFEIIEHSKSDPVRNKRYRDAELYPTVFLHDGRWQWVMAIGAQLEERWRAEGRGPLLQYPVAGIERARVALERLGLPRDAWFVTLHVRETRDANRRNANVLNYLPAVRQITSSGGYVVRIGNRTMTKMPAAAQVIDYAHAERHDWLDVYLLAACRFLIGTNSGPAWVAGTFGVPVLLTNWSPMGVQYYYGNSITLNTRLWSNRDERVLSDAEQMSSPMAYAESDHILRRENVRPVPNSPDEIAASVITMLERTVPTRDLSERADRMLLP